MLTKKGFVFLLYAGVFLLSLTIGWTTIKCIGRPNSPIEISDSDTTEIPIDSPVIIIEVEKTLQKENSYILRVQAENIPEGVTPLYKIESIGKVSAEGYFKNIPGIPSEKYEVVVVDNATDSVLARKTIDGFRYIAPPPPPPVIGMTASEFQTLLLNLSDNSVLGGKNPKVAKYVHLSFQNLRDGDAAPGDIQAVRDKIEFGQWTSARVVSVQYDNVGRVNSAVIRPVYN